MENTQTEISITSKIRSIFNISNLKKDLYEAIVRFPIWIVSIVVTACLLFLNTHLRVTWNIKEIIMKMIFTFIIIFFLNISVVLYCEWKKLSIKWRSVLQAASVIYWMLVYLWFWIEFLTNNENPILIILSLSWSIAYMFVAPFLFNKWDKLIQDNYYSYLYRLSTIMIASSILWWVMSLLWNIWIWAVVTLFDIKNDWIWKAYADWVIISLSIVAPIFALIHLPKPDTFELPDFKENRFFSFIIKYIATPSIYVYFIILYAYTIKVLSNFREWPKWEVSWMVIWFSSFGYLVYMFSYAFHEKSNAIKAFRKTFPFAVIPQLFMLFYAIYLRIAQYDLTMNRYFVVAFWIWLTLISLYLAISKSKKIVMIPSMLMISIILISIWPWSVYNLPEYRQAKALDKYMSEANILQSWKIVPLKDYSDINAELSNNIYDSIRYLCEMNRCRTIKSRFPDQYKQTLKEWREWDNNRFAKNTMNTKISDYEIVAWISEKIKVRSKPYSQFDLENNRVQINIWIWENPFPVDIKWYNKIIQIGNYNKTWWEYSELSSDWNSLIIYNQKYEVDRLLITDIIEKMKEDYKKTKSDLQDKQKMMFIKQTNKGEYKIIIERIDIDNPFYNWGAKNTYRSVSGYILIK